MLQGGEVGEGGLGQVFLHPFLLLGLGEEGLLVQAMELAKHAPFPAKPGDLFDL